MNADMFFSILQDTDGSYLDSAAKSMRIKKAPINRKIQLRPILIAATFILLFTIMIPVGIMMANREEPITPPSIADLPNATPFFDEGTYLSHDEDAAYWQPLKPSINGYAWTKKIIDEKTPVFVGNVVDSNSVVIKDGEIYYHIMTMTVSVSEPICHMENQETIKAVSVAEYRYNPKNERYVIQSIYDPFGELDEFFTYRDMGREALRYSDLHKKYPSMSSTVFLLESVENKTVTIEDETYDLSAYADYYVSAACIYGMELGSFGFVMRGGISLSMLRPSKEEHDYAGEIHCQDCFKYFFENYYKE